MTRIEGFIERLDDTDAVVTKVDRVRETVSRQLLPKQVQVGDFVIQGDDGDFQIDPVRTEKRRLDMRRMSDNCLD